MTELSASVTRVLEGFTSLRGNDEGAIPFLHPESILSAMRPEMVAACVQAIDEDSNFVNAMVEESSSSSGLDGVEAEFAFSFFDFDFNLSL